MQQINRHQVGRSQKIGQSGKRDWKALERISRLKERLDSQLIELLEEEQKVEELREAELKHVSDPQELKRLENILQLERQKASRRIVDVSEQVESDLEVARARNPASFMEGRIMEMRSQILQIQRMQERTGGMIAPPLFKDQSKSEMLAIGSSTGNQRRNSTVNDTDFQNSPSRGNKTGQHNVERHLYIDSGALKLQETKLFSFKRIKGDCDIMQIGFTRDIIVVLTTEGMIYTWGGVSNALGRYVKVQEAFKAKNPQLIDGLTKIVDIACGDDHVLCLDEYGHVYSWGNNNYGQLGRESLGPTYQYAKVDLDAEITQIYASGNMSIAVDRDGKIFGWGENRNDILLRPREDQDRVMSIMEPVKIKEDWETGPKYQIKVGISPEQDSMIVFERKGKKQGQSGMVQDKANQQTVKLQELKKRNQQLEERVRDLEKQLNDDEGQGEAETTNINKNRDYSGITENIDSMTRDLQMNIDKLIFQKQELEQQLEIINDDIELTLKRMKESEIKGRELKAEIEEQSRLMNENQGRGDFDKYHVRVRELEELLLANTELKSKIHSNLNDREKTKFSLHQKIQQTEKQLSDLDRNKKLLSEFRKESRQLFIYRYLSSNLQDLEKMFEAFRNLHLMLKQTEIAHICRISKDQLRYSDAIQKSEKQMDGILVEAGDLKIGADDPRFDIFSVLYNLFDDNIKLRKMINDYVAAILEQTQQKYEKFIQEYNQGSVESTYPEESERVAKYIKLHKTGQNVNTFQEGPESKITRLPMLFAYEGTHNRKNDLQFRFGDQEEAQKKREKPRYKCC